MVEKQSEGGLVVYEQKPMTAQSVLAQVQLIQQVMKSVMKEGQHYGNIPGCGNKPSLLKAGAEKLLETFQLAPDYEITPEETSDRISYRIKCKLHTIGMGKFVGSGVGCGSTDEEKYKWRKVVSEEEWEATPADRRRLKFLSGGGSIKQIRTNPKDVENTILKMAKKRALVDATLTVTAASDIFAQDLEDLPYINGEVVDSSSKHTSSPTDEQPQSGEQTYASDKHKEVWLKIMQMEGASVEDSKEYLRKLTAGKGKNKKGEIVTYRGYENINDIKSEPQLNYIAARVDEDFKKFQGE